MTKLKPVLGRGLASLIPRPLPATPAPMPQSQGDDGGSVDVIISIDLERISRNPYQPRADFDPVALDELRQSIQEKGVIQPITVRRTGEGFQLISGERRVRAAKEAGLFRIPAYVIRVETNEDMLELALIENLQREHLNPIEVAISYKRLIEECVLTQEEVSRRIGKERSTVTNTLRLLKLPEIVQTAVRKGDLTSGHARALLAVEDPALQIGLFQRTVQKDLSVRQVENLVRNLGKKREARSSTLRIAVVNSSVASLEDRLRQVLGTKVTIKPMNGGKGEIVVEYYSPGDLERLIDVLEGQQDRSYL